MRARVCVCERARVCVIKTRANQTQGILRSTLAEFERKTVRPKQRFLQKATKKKKLIDLDHTQNGT